MDLRLILVWTEQCGLPLTVAALLLVVAETTWLGWGAKGALLVAAVPHVLILGRWTPLWTARVPCAALTAIPLDLAVGPVPESLFAIPALPATANPGAWATFGAAGAAWLLAGFYATTLVGLVNGLRPPSGEPVRLASPLGPGRYLVIAGGRGEAINPHIRCLRDRRLARMRGQAYATDILGLDRHGAIAASPVSRAPLDCAISGRRVVAPADAIVAAASDGVPDEPQSGALGEEPADPAGNHVWLQYGAVRVLLAHLKRGTIAVAPGQTVRAGDHLGEVGNSGNSTEPHLHIHVQRPGLRRYPMAARPLPFTIEGIGPLHRQLRFVVPPDGAPPRQEGIRWPGIGAP